MIVGYGIDIIEVSRINEIINRYDSRFFNRIYTINEQEYCNRRKSGSVQSYAALWAVKEATTKALGTGLRNGVKMRDIEVLHELTGKPYIKLYDKSKIIAQNLNVDNIVVSMSHLEDIAIGSVIFENNK